MQCVDLHTHTTASDGTDSPAELMRRAAAMGLAAVAVTDHDTLAGLPEAEAQARALGVELIRGCELSTATELGELHILGLWLPRAPQPLQQKLAQVRALRNARNERIVQKLQALGLPIHMAEVQAASRGESVGRPHIAAVLLQKGCVESLQEAFRQYLGSRGRAFVPKAVMLPEEAVALLAGVGATVSLAHPLLWKGPAGWLEGMVARLKACGLSAIEAWHSEHSRADVRTCLALARRFDLGVSGGSDYHGGNKPGIGLGVGRGNLRLPLALMHALQARRRAMGLPC